jgi:type IV pilus assembly protein PilW
MTVIYSQSYRRNKGFSLIELMIAMMLGLFVLAGVLQIFSATKQLYRLQGSFAQLQEDGRSALTLISQDLRMAGYWGCGQVSPSTAGFVGGGNFYSKFGIALEGFDAASPSVWTPGLDASFTQDNRYTPLVGSDVLTLRRVNAPGILVSQHASPSASLLLDENVTDEQLIHAEISDENHKKKAFLAIVSNCTQAEAFQSTDISLNPIEHKSISPNPNTWLPGNNSDSLLATYQNAKVYVAHTISYYVTKNANKKTVLYRKIDGVLADESELVEGVEDMQILYGVDNNKDAAETPDYYVDAGKVTPENWKNVVSVRVSFLVATLEDNIADHPVMYEFNEGKKIPNDRKLRRIFTSTIKLRNKFG